MKLSAWIQDSSDISIYIYIQRERERERERKKKRERESKRIKGETQVAINGPHIYIAL